MSDQAAGSPQQQLTLGTSSEPSLHFGRRVVDSAPFGEKLGEESRDRQRHQAGWLVV